MELVELTEEIVKSLVVDKDAVSVKEFPTEEDNVMLIQVMVNEDDGFEILQPDHEDSTPHAVIKQTV